MAHMVYNSFLTEEAQGLFDLDSNNLYMMLTTNSYVPARTHNRRDDITNEVSGSGYTTGGQLLTGVTVTQDDGNNRAVIDANDVVWNPATITAARYGIVYQSLGGAASADRLICALDFGADYSSVAGPFTVQFPATGIFIKNQG